MTVPQLIVIVTLALVVSLQLVTIAAVARRQVKVSRNLDLSLKSVASRLGAVVTRTEDGPHDVSLTLATDAFGLEAAPYVYKRRRHFQFFRFRIVAWSSGHTKVRVMSMREASDPDCLLAAVTETLSELQAKVNQ